MIDTSTLVNFSTEGSGDWDSWCSSYPVGIWLCSSTPNPQGSDLLSIDWVSNISGALTPEGEDWLIWEGWMPVGNHTVTVTFDDLLGGVSSASFTIDVAQSAPVLGLVTPFDGQGFLSKDTIYIDASDSIDFDGDDFTLSVVSDHPLVNGPILEEVADEKKDLITIYKLNIDENPETPQKYGVRGIPTLMFFKDGKLMDTKIGSLPKSSINEWIDNTLNV